MHSTAQRVTQKSGREGNPRPPLSQRPGGRAFTELGWILNMLPTMEATGNCVPLSQQLVKVPLEGDLEVLQWDRPMNAKPTITQAQITGGARQPGDR